jgi:UDP-glucose 4-epimerase
MTTVAVTAASGPVGRALMAALDADPAVSRIIGLDVVTPPMPVGKLDYRPADLRDPVLPVALEGSDVLVHLGLTDEVSREVDTLFARNVHGTRNLLAAAGKVGVGALVHLSGAAAYGAHPDNPVPLTEQSPLRANPDDVSAYHRLLAEELVEEWAEAHPAARVAVLRAATVMGPGVDSPTRRLLLGPRLLQIAGHEPPLQFVHVEDLAAALALAVTGNLAGPYNVAADGWLSVAEACAVLGTRPFHLPEAVAFSAAAWLWDRGLWNAPPGCLHAAMHPRVLATERMHAAGWSATRTNREVLRELTSVREHVVALGPATVRRRDLAVGVLATTGLLLGLAVGARARRRGRRRTRGGSA